MNLGEIKLHRFELHPDSLDWNDTLGILTQFQNSDFISVIYYNFLSILGIVLNINSGIQQSRLLMIMSFLALVKYLINSAKENRT